MLMKEFLLVFQKDYQIQLTPKQLQNHLKNYQEWLLNLAVNDMLASKLQRWDDKGRVIKGDQKIIAGPFTESEKSIEGLLIVYAACYEEAKEIAEGCPVLELGGLVEIRMVI